MKKHLNYEDRLDIQAGLNQGKSLTAIGKEIRKDRTTIGREIKARAIPSKDALGNDCIYRYDCDVIKKCSYKETCFRKGKRCKSLCWLCKEGCLDYEKEVCERLNVAPYVCNGCKNRKACHLSRVIYDAKSAQQNYEMLMSESRKGIGVDEDELFVINNVLSPELKRGISVAVACHMHKDEIPVCMKTVYSYIQAGLLDADNFDLRRKIGMKKRKKSGPNLRVDKSCHIGRCYEDYLEYVANNPERTVAQMDTVEGSRGSIQVILTIKLLNCGVQLMYLLPRKTSKEVTEQFDKLRETLGIERFRQLFQVILMDRGSEFTDPKKIEMDVLTGEKIVETFYCDPMRSNQKSQCERNHEFIRYVLPKGTSFKNLTDKDVRIVMNHVNSYPREKWNWQAPIDVFHAIYGVALAKKLGLKKVPFGSINLTPDLLK